MPENITKLNDDTFAFTDQFVRFFLLLGSEKALLIDSGMGMKDIKSKVAELTDLPVELINTHADRDHIGGNAEFDRFYMHPAECSNYYKTANAKGAVCPVFDGDVIDLGGRKIRVIELPGHTPGSIALLDERDRALFSGDPIQDGQIYLFGIQRELHGYALGLQNLIDRHYDEFDTIYPSHGSLTIDKSMIKVLIESAWDVLEGRLAAQDIEYMGMPLKIADAKIASFLLDR